MPIYEYECRKCKAHTEVYQKITDKPRTRCPKCKGRLEKLMSASAIRFKGKGWYVTDYANKGKQAEGGEDKKGDSLEAAPASDKTAPASDKTATASDKTKPKDTRASKSTSTESAATSKPSGGS